MHRFLEATLVFVISIAAGRAVPALECLSATVQVSAERSTDPGFAGFYKYTVLASWSLSSSVHGVSQFSIEIAEQDSCSCACATDLVRFPDTAGSTSGRQRGTGAPCTTNYLGSYRCQGEASVGTTGPTVVFQAVGQDCENASASGKWIFYSLLSPTAASDHADAAILRYQNSQCTAGIRGVLPDCHACNGVPVVAETWENFKRLYR